MRGNRSRGMGCCDWAGFVAWMFSNQTSFSSTWRMLAEWGSGDSFIRFVEWQDFSLGFGFARRRLENNETVTDSRWSGELVALFFVESRVYCVFHRSASRSIHLSRGVGPLFLRVLEGFWKSILYRVLTLERITYYQFGTWLQFLQETLPLILQQHRRYDQSLKVGDEVDFVVCQL